MQSFVDIAKKNLPKEGKVESEIELN